MLTSKMIKEAAYAAGADKCGIAPISKLSGAPDEMNPKFLFPEAKSVIGFVFRIPRGVQRGIEEGTQFFQYPSMAYGGINEIFAPSVLYQVGKVIEDEGYEAFVYRNTGARGVVSDMDGSPGNTLSPEEQIEIDEHAKTATAHHRTVQFTRAAREDAVAPDLQFQFRLVAVACGLGEIGWSKMLLTPEFGPLQRLAFIFTDAELEPSPLSNPHLCDRCGKCKSACPGDAINDEGKVDPWQCSAYYKGANGLKNPFMPPDAFADFEDRLDIIAGKTELSPEKARSIIDKLVFYPSISHGYQCSICGKACDVACYVHLEEKGILKRKTKSPFKKREEWNLAGFLLIAFLKWVLTAVTSMLKM